MSLVLCLVFNVAVVVWNTHLLLGAAEYHGVYAVCIAFNAFVAGLLTSRIAEESRT